MSAKQAPKLKRLSSSGIEPEPSRLPESANKLKRENGEIYRKGLLEDYENLKIPNLLGLRRK
jgi:hypothetical protein